MLTSIAEYGYLVDKGDNIYVEYGGILQEVKEVKYSDYGIVLATDYGTYIAPYGGLFKGLIKGIGSVIHGVAKGTGRVIHYAGKALGKVAPFVIPLAVGVGISALAGHLFGATVAQASAETVAKAVMAGNIASAGVQAVAFTGKVIATQLVSSTILNAIYKRPHGEVVIARGRQPVLIIPRFVREVVEPHALVRFITQNGRLKSSKQIQARVDWLGNKIKVTAKQIVNLYQEWGIKPSVEEVVSHLRNIFYQLPPDEAGVERKIREYLAGLRRNLCKKYVEDAYSQAVTVAPAGFGSKYPLSKYLQLCNSNASKGAITSRLLNDVKAYREYIEKQRELERQKELERLRKLQQQQQQQQQMAQMVARKSQTMATAGMITSGFQIKPEYLLLGGVVLLLLLRRKRREEIVTYAPPYRP